MRTELLFESCPFLTSANVTLSRLGFADGDALWEIMQDEELYRYEYEAPAKERVQAEYKIQDANAQFAAKRTVTLGVYANTDLAHLIGWIEIGGADESMNMVQLRFLFLAAGGMYAAAVWARNIRQKLWARCAATCLRWHARTACSPFA